MFHVEHSGRAEAAGSCSTGYTNPADVPRGTCPRAALAAAALTAAALPEDGHSPAAVVAIGVGWLALAAGYVTSSRRTSA